MRVVPTPLAFTQRHRHVQGPQRTALLSVQPARCQGGIEQHLHPARHVAQRTTDAAGRHRRQVRADRSIRVHYRVAITAPGMRLRHVAHALHRPRPHLAARHAQWFEHLLAHQLVVRLATRCRRHFPGHHVHQVVVGVAAAEAADRFQVRQPRDDVRTGERVRFRPQHQVTGAQAQAAVVDQQVAYLHLLAHPRIVHAEARQILLHRILPAQLALLHQSRQQRGGHRLAVGGDLEQRVLVDAAAVATRAFGVAIDHLPVVDHRYGQPGQVLVLDHSGDVGIEGGDIGRRSGRCGQCRRDDQQVVHARSPSIARAVTVDGADRGLRSSRSPPAGCSAGLASASRWRTSLRGTGRAALHSAGAR